MFCSNCGAQIADGARFCSSCGTQVQAVRLKIPFKKAGRMKWIIAVTLVFVVLTGCGDHEEYGYSKANSGDSSAVVEDIYPSKDESSEVDSVDETEPALVVEPDEVPNAAGAAEIEEAELTWTDHNGYTFRATYGLSDWIADEEALKATWDSVSTGKSQPDFSNNMSLGDFMRNNGKICGHETNEIAYLVGYFEVENVTSNFAITETNPVEIIIELYTNTPYAMLQTSSGNIFLPHWTTSADITTAGLYKKGDGFFGDGIYCTMKSDRLSRIPFIIALSISSTPNQPEGAPDPAQVVVTARCYDWNSRERSEHVFVPKMVEP